MTLKNFLRGLGRRWYVVLIGLILTGVAAGVVYSEVQPTYQRDASLLLMPAPSSVPEGENPYLYLGGLGPASDVLVNTMASQTVRASLLDGHPAADVAIRRLATSTGPLLSVTATGSSDSEVAEVFDRALTGVQSNLGSLQTQASVPASQRITLIPLSTDEASTIIQKSRLEAVAATAAAGFALTLLLAGFVDGLLLSRARRRRLSARVTSPASASDNASDDEFDDAPEDAAEDADLDPDGDLTTGDTDGGRDAPASPREPDPVRSGDLRVLAGEHNGFEASVTSTKRGARTRAPEHVE